MSKLIKAICTAAAPLILSLGPSSVQGAFASHDNGPISWNFDDGAHRFRIQTDIQVPERVTLGAAQNKSLRTQQIQMTLITECAKDSERGKKGWNLDCEIEDISIRVNPLEQNADEQILHEWTTRLKGAMLDVAFRRDGRLVSVDIESMEKQNDRDGLILSSMEVILERVRLTYLWIRQLS